MGDERADGEGENSPRNYSKGREIPGRINIKFLSIEINKN